MTSVGANYDEAQAASSKGDFIHKIKIALGSKGIKLLAAYVSGFKLQF